MTRHIFVLASATLLLVGCPSAQVQKAPTKIPTKVAAPTTPAETPAAAPAEPTKPAEETPAANAVVDLTPTETTAEKEAREAAELRRKEEEELARKEEERKASEEKAKAIEAKLAEAFAQATTSLKAGNVDEAIVAVQRTVEEQPDAFAAYYNLGLLHERKGEREKAIEAYRQAMALKPDYEEASANLTRLYIRGNQLQRAEGELRRRILAFPRNTAFRNQLVRVLIEQGGDRINQAEAESKRVLKFDERNVDAMVNLATIWFREGKFELAKQVLDNAREIEPNNPAVWNLIAFTQLKLDMKPLALDSFRKAAELREDFPEAHNNLGAMLNEVNDCDGAIRELEKAVSFAPDWAQARMNLGNAYRCARQYEKAQKEYEAALALDQAPGGTRRMNDPYFNLAILYLDGDIPNVEKLDRLQQSVAYFDQYSKAGGDDPRTQRYLEEAKKGIEKEAKRLERVAEQKRKDEERKRKEEERRKAEEEKRKAELAARQAEIERLKVAGKSDIEIDGPTPSPAAPPAPPPKMQKLPKEDL